MKTQAGAGTSNPLPLPSLQQSSPRCKLLRRCGISSCQSGSPARQWLNSIKWKWEKNGTFCSGQERCLQLTSHWSEGSPIAPGLTPLEKKVGRRGGGSQRQGKEWQPPNFLGICSYLENFSMSHPLIFSVSPAGVSQVFYSIHGRVPMCTFDSCFSQTSGHFIQCPNIPPWTWWSCPEGFTSGTSGRG